jgi:ribonucleotide reductase alpha subunit
MAAKQEQIEVIAAVAKIQTLVDGGLRVTLDLPESAIVEVAWLMACKRDGVAVKAIITVDE